MTFGLVNVPVKLYSATEDHDISLHQVHDKDGGRIRYQRRCEICGEVVDYAHIDKAYEEGEQTVVLTDDDLASLPQERSREIEVVEFVPSDQLDPVMYERSYYLEPDSKSAKSYALLLQTLQDSDRTAIVQFSLRQKTRLGALRARGKVLLLQSLLWDDEIREADFPALEDQVRVSAKERQMSAALVDSFSADFEPEKFTDEYQTELRTLIEAKLESGDTVDTAATFGEEPEKEGQVVDLMEALKRSIERKRAAGDGAEAGAKAAQSTKAAKSTSKPAVKSPKSTSKTASPTAAKPETKSATKSTAKAGAKTGSKSSAKPAAATGGEQPEQKKRA